MIIWLVDALILSVLVCQGLYWNATERITNKTDTAPDVRLLTTISYPSRKVTESAWVRGRDLVFMKALQKFLFPVKRISTVKGEKRICTIH